MKSVNDDDNDKNSPSSTTLTKTNLKLFPLQSIEPIEIEVNEKDHNTIS